MCLVKQKQLFGQIKDKNGAKTITSLAVFRPRPELKKYADIISHKICDTSW